MNKYKLTLDHMSDPDYLKAFLLERVVDKQLRLKIEHSSSLGFLRDEFYKLEHPVIKKEDYGYYY